MKTDNNVEILKRLDAMVFLLLELKDRDGKMPLKNKIKLLNDAGLNYTQIANMLGRSPGSIAVQLTMLKKGKENSPKEEIKVPKEDIDNEGK